MRDLQLVAVWLFIELFSFPFFFGVVWVGGAGVFKHPKHPLLVRPSDSRA